MAQPKISDYYATREPSAVRLAQIEFAKRKDIVKTVNVAIGNVSLPMHPAMIQRLHHLGSPQSPFNTGIVRYTETVGLKETNEAFMHILASSGLPITGMYSQITDGGSQAMELTVLGVGGSPGKGDRPLLLIDPAYPNYKSVAHRLGRSTISISRLLSDSGKFNLPNLEGIERIIEEHKPNSIVMIPYDNPTGQFYDHATLVELARLAVKHNLWIVSDEAYRELFYTKSKAVSVWALTEQEVPGITGRRISIESASKVWNACGLRIGALITDNEEFHKKSVAENTFGLCSNAPGQYVFGALAQETPADFHRWYAQQREYYKGLMFDFKDAMEEVLPGAIVSSPDAALYSVVDVRNLVKPGFGITDFVLFCCREGKVKLDDSEYTLLAAPMSGFYSAPKGKNPGDTQMRIAYVESAEQMQKVPVLLKELLGQYTQRRT